MKPGLSGLAMAAALVLAACGGTASPSTAPPSQPSSAAPKPSVAASSSASAKPSAVTSTAATTGALKLGIDNPLTGAQAAAGLDYQEGFNLYLDSVNKTIAGRQIDATYVDDQAQADVGLTKIKQLVENQHVPILMGFTFTPVTYAAATYVKDQAHIPMLVTTAATGQGLMLDPKLTSPYLVRFTNVSAAHADTTADWAIKQGYKKMVVVTYDTAAGVETGDLVGSAFVSRGGQVVQEMHPAFGTTDFGPYLAKLDPSADVVAIWEPASDGVHFLEQFANYSGQKKQVVVDMGGAATGDSLDELGDRAVGVVVETTWADSLDNAQNQAFMKAFAAKNPKKSPAPILVNGWASGAILESALQKAGGKVEDNPSFLQAVYSVDVQTAGGEIKLDPSSHDVVRSYYITKVAKRSNGTYGYDVMATYNNVSQFWDRKPDDLRAFPYGKLKDQWTSMTKDKLASIHGLTQAPS